VCVCMCVCACISEGERDEFVNHYYYVYVTHTHIHAHTHIHTLLNLCDITYSHVIFQGLEMIFRVGFAILQLILDELLARDMEGMITVCMNKFSHD